MGNIILINKGINETVDDNGANLRRVAKEKGICCRVIFIAFQMCRCPLITLLFFL